MSNTDHFNKTKYLKDLGRKIAKARASKGYSQDRVALEAGFSRGTLYKIEGGMVDPKVTTLARIAETIGISISKLIS